MSIPNVAFLGTSGGVCFASSGFDNALTEIGQNTGNAMFQFALWKLIKNPKFVVESSSSPEATRKAADILVIPAANQINAAWDLTAWADFVENCDLPVVCLGLGAQAAMNSNPKDLELQPGTRRFLTAVAARTDKIGVRGQFTQDALENLGVSNTIITGCPSQTINPNLSGQRISERIETFSSIANPKINYVLGTLEEEARASERILASAIAPYQHDLLLQTDPILLRAVYDRKIDANHVDYMRWIGTTMRPDLTRDEFFAYFLRTARFYSDAQSWIDSMRRFDLTIGMRIHGAVAGIQADKLGVCVAFDSRTKELAHTMGYPYLEGPEVLKEGMSINDILKLVVFSAERFDHLHKKNSDKVKDILLSAGCLL